MSYQEYEDIGSKTDGDPIEIINNNNSIILTCYINVYK